MMRALPSVLCPRLHRGGAAGAGGGAWGRRLRSRSMRRSPQRLDPRLHRLRRHGPEGGGGGAWEAGRGAWEGDYGAYNLLRRRLEPTLSPDFCSKVGTQAPLPVGRKNSNQESNSVNQDLDSGKLSGVNQDLDDSGKLYLFKKRARNVGWRV